MGKWIGALLAWALLGAAWAQADLEDTSLGGGRDGGSFFVLEALDGQPVKTNAMRESRGRSFGAGMELSIAFHRHAVPAGRPLKLKIAGRHTYAAPVQSLFKSMFGGGSPSVEGEVTVELSAGKRYRVNGVLDPMRREVWIEDDTGAVLPGTLLVNPPDPQLLKAMEGAHFATVNLHYQDDWIGNGAGPDLPFAAVGARVKVLDWGRHRASVLVDGRKMRIGVDWAREKETIQQFVARITSPEDPRERVAAWPAAVRDAVRAGRVMIGMTREQVQVSFGPPRPDKTPSLDAAEWHYELSGTDPMRLVFGDDGRLKEVDAHEFHVKTLLVPPPATSAGAPAPAAASAPQ